MKEIDRKPSLMAENNPDNKNLKNSIIRFCTEHGADIIGFAPASRWDETGEVPPDFRPRTLFPPTQTVIVLGIGMPLPIVETTPSIMHKELYDTCNQELDSLAFQLVRFLNRQGWASSYFSRDGYGSLKLLKKRMAAAFGHVMAARYAGLGTIGMSNNLLTPEFGSRVRFISVFTSAIVEGSPPLDKDLCIKCLGCVKCCPKKALTEHGKQIPAEFNKLACAEMAQELSRRRCYPCGICTKVCPVGRDRNLYKQKGILKKYLKESEALAADPDDPEYRSWTHVRKYGAWQPGEQEGEKE